MDPDKIDIQLSGTGHQGFFRQGIDAHLGNFLQKNVAGVDVDDHIAAAEIVNDAGGDVFRHGAVLRAGENAVHVQIKGRNAPGDGIDAQGVQGRVHIHDAPQMLRMLPDAALQFIADVLPFQLVAVGAGDDADTLARRHCFRGQAVFLNLQGFVHGIAHGHHCFYHNYSLCKR